MTTPISSADQQMAPITSARADGKNSPAVAADFASLLDSFGGRPPTPDFLGQHNVAVGTADHFNADGFFAHGQSVETTPISHSGNQPAMDVAALKAVIMTLVGQVGSATVSCDGDQPQPAARSVPAASRAIQITDTAAKRPTTTRAGVPAPVVQARTELGELTSSASHAAPNLQLGNAKAAAKLAVVIEGSAVRIVGLAHLSTEEESRLTKQIEDLLASHGLTSTGVWINGQLLTAIYKGQR